MEFLKLIYVNVFFYLFFLIYSGIGIPLLTLGVAFCRPFLGHRRTMKRFRRAINFYGYSIVKLAKVFFIQVEYEDLRKEENKKPCIYICNHRSFSDSFLIAWFPDEMVIVVKEWPFRIPVLGPFAKWAGYLSIREMAFEDFSENCQNLFDKGVSIASFPEGTRGGKNEVGQFHGAILRVALEKGIDIVPVCICGNEETPKKGSFLMKPAKVKMKILPRLKWEEFKNMKPFNLKNHVRSIIIEELGRMEGLG